jgi:hypothetical protein
MAVGFPRDNRAAGNARQVHRANFRAAAAVGGTSRKYRRIFESLTMPGRAILPSVKEFAITVIAGLVR